MSLIQKRVFHGAKSRKNFILTLHFTLHKMLPPEISKTWEKLLSLGVLCGPGNQCGIQLFFMIWQFLKVSSSIKNSFNFKVGLFTYFEYISGSIIRKYILRSDYQSARWYWCKKYQKNLPQTSHQIFSQCSIFFLNAYEHLRFKVFVKIHFQGVKIEKNGIPVIKITFSLQKIPQNYRFPWVNTKL